MHQKPASVDPILTLPTLRLGSDPTLKDAVVAPPSQLEPAAEALAAGSDLLKSEASKGTCMEMPGSSQQACKGSATQDEPTKTNRSQEDMATDVLQHRPAVLESLAPISPAEQSKASRKTGEEEEEGHDSDSQESEDSKPKTKKRKAKAKACPKPKPKAKAKGKAAREVAKAKGNTRKAKSSEGKPVEDEATSATKRPRRLPPKQGKRKASAPSAPSSPDPSPPASAPTNKEGDARKAEMKARYSRKSAAYVKAYKAGLKDGLKEEDARQKGKDVSRYQFSNHLNKHFVESVFVRVCVCAGPFWCVNQVCIYLIQGLQSY